MYYAEFEHISSLIRVWPEGQKYGDPYWGIAIRQINKYEVELLLQQQKITIDIWKAVIEVCKKEGIKRILAVTYPNGSEDNPKHKWIEVN